MINDETLLPESLVLAKSFPINIAKEGESMYATKGSKSVNLYACQWAGEEGNDQ